MARWRAVLGLVVGAFLLLSAFAHSVLGGSGIRGEMAKVGVPEELAQGLIIGWYLGGAAMLVFGAIVLSAFWSGFRGRRVSLIPPFLIGLGYLGFAVVALVISRFEPFFLAVFGVPGLLLAIASSAPDSGE